MSRFKITIFDAQDGETVVEHTDLFHAVLRQDDGNKCMLFGNGSPMILACLLDGSVESVFEICRQYDDVAPLLVHMLTADKRRTVIDLTAIEKAMRGGGANG